MKTISDLLKDLSREGGAILSSTSCDQANIDLATAEGRAAVDEKTGWVYVRMTQEAINAAAEPKAPESTN